MTHPARCDTPALAMSSACAPCIYRCAIAMTAGPDSALKYFRLIYAACSGYRYDAHQPCLGSISPMSLHPFYFGLGEQTAWYGQLVGHAPESGPAPLASWKMKGPFQIASVRVSKHGLAAVRERGSCRDRFPRATLQAKQGSKRRGATV